MVSNSKADCAKIFKAVVADNDNIMRQKFDLCQSLSTISSHVVLPNFVHSLFFSAILIVYLYKKSIRHPVVVVPTNGKQTFQFAHITVIVEEIV